jgi:hypothetical protein
VATGETGTWWRAAPYLTRTVISGGLGGGAPPPPSRACTTIPLGRTSQPGLSSAAAVTAAAASDHPLLDPPSELERRIAGAAGRGWTAGYLPPPSVVVVRTYVPGIPGASAWGEGEGKEARRGTGFLPVSYIGMRTRFGLTGVKDGSAAPENLTAANFLEMEDSSRRAQAGLHGPY